MACIPENRLVETENGEKVTAYKETDQKALLIDPYAIEWKLKKINKVVPAVVGHIPREISRAIWFFIEKGGSLTGKVFEERCRPSPIPKGGLEIILKVTISINDEKRKYLERLKAIISDNYDAVKTESYSFSDEFKEGTVETENFDTEEVIVFEDDEESEDSDDNEAHELICLD